MAKKGCRVKYILVTPGSPMPFRTTSDGPTRTEISAKEAAKLAGSGYVPKTKGTPGFHVARGRTFLNYARAKACRLGTPYEIGDRWGGAGRILIVPVKEK